jgi:molecular chaperone GrpE (heat shock protein)
MTVDCTPMYHDLLQDKYMRALAEAENTRRRSAIEIENQKQFAITKFAQSLLEVCVSVRRPQCVAASD